MRYWLLMLTEGLWRQVRHLFRQHGIRIDRTERVANSLGNLAGVATRLRAMPPSVKVYSENTLLLPYPVSPGAWPSRWAT